MQNLKSHYIKDLIKIEKPVLIKCFYNNHTEFFGNQKDIPKWLGEITAKIVTDYPDRLEIYF